MPAALQGKRKLKMGTYKVLDVYALMPNLEGDREAKDVLGLLMRARRGEIRLWITPVNLGEFHYGVIKTNSEEVADQQVQQPIEILLEMTEDSWGLARQAAQFKTSVPISSRES